MIVLPSGPIEVGSRPLPHDVVILPSKLDGTVGSYVRPSARLVSQLQAAGIDAGFWNERDQMRWRLGIDHSILELVIGFGAAMAGGAAWEATKAVLKKMFDGQGQVRVKVVRQRQDAGGALNNEWYEFTGDPESFIAAISGVIEEEDQA